MNESDPNIVARLVALNERTRKAWAHPHNKPFYTPASVQSFSVRDGKRPESAILVEDTSSHHRVQGTEPELRLCLTNRPKDISKGWVFGSDPNACDIYCGEHDKAQNYNIGRQTFAITINEQCDVILKHLKDTNRTEVQYDSQKPGDRREFVWIMFPFCASIVVTSANWLRFQVIVAGPSTPMEMCKRLRLRFLQDVKNSMPSMPLPSIDRETTTADTSLVSTRKTHPFYYVRKDQVLGCGSFGEVSVVIDVSSGIEYAGKMLFGEIYQNEVDILTKKKHENILNYVNWSNNDGSLLVTKYLRGGNLARPWQVKDRGTWQIDQILSILTQSLRGLASLHAGPNPVTHRHIKPENILVADHERVEEPPETGPWIKLADFGLARNGTKCKDQAGTWLYTAPEVFFDGYDSVKVDMWSLGVVIIQLLLDGRIPRPTKRWLHGPYWCADLVRLARQNWSSSLSQDKFDLNRYEYSLKTWLWGFVAGSMLQLDPNKRLSAQECLDHVMFLEMQPAARLASGWRRQQPNANQEGDWGSTKLSITKQFKPKAKGSLPSTKQEKTSPVAFDSGVEVAEALKDQGLQGPKTSKPQAYPPWPLSFGLVVEDDTNDTRGKQREIDVKKSTRRPDRVSKPRETAKPARTLQPESSSRARRGGQSVAGPSRAPSDNQQNRTSDMQRQGSSSVTSRRKKSSVSTAAAGSSANGAASSATAPDNDEELPPANIPLLKECEGIYGKRMLKWMKDDGEFPDLKQKFTGWDDWRNVD